MSNVEAFATDDVRELYRELILDHARKPRHFGRLENVTHSADGINPLCGDKLHLYLHLNESQEITDVSFEGSGCAISVASASLLAETVLGLSKDEAMRFFDVVTARLTGETTPSGDVDLGKLQALEGVREFPMRVKCATLAWHALRSAIEQNPSPATTE